MKFRKRFTAAGLLGLLGLAVLLNTIIPAASAPPQAAAQLLFVENVGQFDTAVRYQIWGTENLLWLTDDALWLVYLPGENAAGDGLPAVPQHSAAAGIRVQFEGANPSPRLEPIMQLETNISYYRGNDPAQWHQSVPVWGGVRYVDLYPGVDLEVSSQQGQIAWKLISREGKAPQVGLRVEGAAVLSAGANGLHLGTPLGDVFLPLPDGELPLHVAGNAPDGRNLLIGIPSSPPKETPPLAHAPAASEDLLYGTYLGGSNWDEGHAIASGADGSIYLAGQTLSLDFPDPDTPPLGLFAPAHNIEAYVCKFKPSGTLDYMELFIGNDDNNEEFTMGMVVDGNGNAYAVGHTNSSDFPTTPGAFDTTPAGGYDVFVVKINPGGTLVYSTLLGNTSADTGSGIVVDVLGNALVTGGTWSTDFPTTPGAHDTTHNGQRDIFLVKVNADGSDVLYGTFFGGSGQDQGEAIALVGLDTVFLTGWTRSDDFPTTPGAFDTGYNGGFEAFVLKTTLSSATLDYSTYLGGGDEDRGFGLTIDADGQAVVAGLTKSDDFPATPGSFDDSFGGGVCDFAPCPDAFLAKLASDGASLVYAAYLGGSEMDEGADIVLDGEGNLYLTGITGSSDFPFTADGYDITLEGGHDAFAAVVSADGVALTYASYLGGNNWDNGNAIALGPTGYMYLGGKTLSDDFPTTQGAYDLDANGDYDAFAVVLALPGEAPTPTVTPTQGGTTATFTPTPTVTPTQGSATATFTPTATPTDAALFLPIVVAEE